MKKIVVFLLLLTLIRTTTIVQTRLKNTRSGSKRLIITAKPTSQPSQTIGYIITFQRPFQSGSNSQIKVVFGMTGFNQFQIPSFSDRKKHLTATSMTTQSFNATIFSTYIGQRSYDMYFLAIMNVQNFYFTDLQQINLQTECLAGDSHVKDQQCSDSTGSGLNCRVCLLSYTIPGIEPSFQSSVWITGFGVDGFNNFYIKLDVNEVVSNQYTLRVDWVIQFARLYLINFNVLFINYAGMNQSNHEIYFKQFTNSDFDIRNNLDNAPSTFITGVDTLRFFAPQSVYIYWTINDSLSTEYGGSNSYTLVFNSFIMRSKCDSSCYSCHQNRTCILCDYQYYDIHEKCLCSPGMGLNKVNFKCQCHQTCKQCNAKDNRYKCTSCYPQSNREYNHSDNSCSCMRGFSQCNDSTRCLTSKCYPSQSYPITISNITKSQNQNKFSFYVQIHPLQPEFETINFMDVLDFTFPTGCQYSLVYLGNGTIVVDVSYSQDLMGQQIKVVLDPKKINDPRPQFLKFVAAESTSSTVEIVFQNGSPALAYPEDIYTKSKIITYCIYGILGAVLLNLLLGFADRSKVTVSQMIGVLQLSYFGMIITGTYRGPLMIPMADLKYSNGYNLQIKSLQSFETPMNFVLTKISTSIPANINIMWVLILLPLLAAGICYIISLIHIRQRVIYQKTIKLIIGEYLLICLIFISFDLSFSFAAFLMYRNTTFLSAILGYCGFGVFIILIVMQLVLFAKKDYMYFGQYKYSMKTDEFSIGYYYFIPILQRIIIGGILGAINNSFISGAAVMVILAGQIVVIIVKKPYSDRFHNQRAIFNNAVAILIMGIYVMLNIKGNTNSPMVIYSPFIVIGLDLICVCVSLAFTLKRTIASLTNKIAEEMQYVSNHENVERADQQLLQMLETNMKTQKQNPIHKMMINTIVHKKRRKRSNKLKHLLQGNTDVDEVISKQNPNQLNVEKILEVDQMLKEGLV